MFVVTGLHTKRRPHIGTDKSGTTIRKQCVDRLSLLPVVSNSRRRLCPVKFSASASSSGQGAPRVSERRMAWNDSDWDAWNRNEKGRRSPTKLPLGRVAPTRARKFIPKPLILVERMKARHLLPESSPPVASESRTTPGSLNRPMTAMTTPLSTLVTPMARRIPTCSTLSSDSCYSSGVSFRVSLRNDVVFGSGSGMMPRSARPLSVVTLGDSSASTDTFVADSPCCIKRPSFRVPLLVTAADATDVRLDVGSDPGKKSVSYTDVSVLVDSVTADIVHRTQQWTDTFQPAAMSTPFSSSQANTNGVPSPTAFITSTVYPTLPLEKTPGLPDSFDIVPPTSRAVYPFNAPKGAYIVKLPNSGSSISLSNTTSLASSSSTAVFSSRLTNSGAPPATLANAPTPALDFRRLSNRAASASPTLVFDGVFALPHPSPSSSPSPRRTLNSFPRPRRLMSRRPLSNLSNAPAVASPPRPPPTSPTSFRGQSGPESPRSKLAHVLTAHARPHTMTRVRKQAHVPPLVKGVQVSNNLRTQCSIEGLRVRGVIGFGRDGGGDVGGDGDGRGAIEKMSLAGVGMVAKLRARWETGAVECCVRVDGCA
jgi:hypothetical protein